MKTAYRHGDVLIVAVEKIEGKKLDHLTLAEGEATGHSHRISDGAAALFQFDDKMYLEVQSDLVLPCRTKQLRKLDKLKQKRLCSLKVFLYSSF